MKKWIKAPLKAIWRLTFPLRRPLILHLSALIARSVPTPTLHCHVSEETSLVMDHMVRELVRLQKQVEHLQMVVEEQASLRENNGLAVIGTDSHRRSVAG